METLLDRTFWLGVLSSMVAAWFLWLLARLLNIRIPRPTRWLWATLFRDAHVVITQIPGNYDVQLKTGKQPPLTPIGDALALSELLHHADSNFRAKLTLSYIFDDADWNRIRAKNLIIIGGPKYNVAAREVLSKLENNLKYQTARLQVPRDQWQREDLNLKKFVLNPNEDVGVKEYGLSTSDTVDYASVVWARNPFNQDARILVVNGLTTLSTLAAMRWLVSAWGWSWVHNMIGGQGVQIMLTCNAIDPITVTTQRPVSISRISARR